jgi:hypothetical protein
MNDSFAQHAAQTPTPATGSRQATHSVGSATSSASRAACAQTARKVWPNDRDDVASIGEG